MLISAAICDAARAAASPPAATRPIAPALSLVRNVALTGGLAAAVAACLGIAAVLLDLHLRRLYRQKTLLNELFEQAPLAVALTTIAGRVLRINRGFTNIFGYSPQAALGRPLSELIVPAESQSEHAIHAASVAHGQRVDTEGTRARQDGSRFPASITMVPFSAPGQDNAVYAIYRDITEQRRAEQAQRAIEGRWRAVFENTAVGLSLTDRQGKFVVTNQAYQEITGYSDDELRGLSYMDLTLEEDRPASAAAAMENWSGRLPRFQLEKRYRRKDGQTIWVRITVSRTSGSSAAPEFGFAIVEDITERKQAEARRREYEKVVEGLQEMILVVDRDYRYLIANQAFLSYHGLQREQVVGHLVSELLGPETFEGATKFNLDECFRGRVVKCELSITFSKQGRRDIFASYLPIEGSSGVDRVAVVLEDITERKRHERELQRSFHELQALNARLQSVREEERTRLSRELHDQLGQSLTAIRYDLASLKTTPGKDQQWLRIDAISGLIDTTMYSVRRISAELRPGILDDLGLLAAAEWAAEEFQERTGIHCRVSLPRHAPPIESCRSTAVFRILQESLTNITRHAGATQVEINLSIEAFNLVLEIRDNGRGIAPEQAASPTSLGILGMRERALLLGGDFFIGAAGGGTIIRVRMPAGPAVMRSAPQ
jgi:PAS domain S-box-containing protein